MSVIKNNGKIYEGVIGTEYAAFLRENTALEVVAEKSGCVIATKAKGGEKITTYNSKGEVEAVETADKGNWILSRANFDGTMFTDEFGHNNTWCIKPKDGKTSDELIAKKYDMANIAENGFVKPKGGLQTFLQIHKNIFLMVPWGEGGSLIPQFISAGGFINVTNPSDIYGIGEEEFYSTYRLISSN